MSFFTILYTLIIYPIELLFENIFMIANRIIGNTGLAIIFLSLAVNFLVLPLYQRADELQAEERDIQQKMAFGIKHIKRTFKGDERFFMIQEYYRLHNYKPVYALKSSLSLLLQIPFFIAAYNLLSGMQSLQGMSFGFISDLGKEDAMFMIGSFPVNILPILMTLINIVSGIIYTKGHPLKSKIQVYGLAAVFLVLLYRSPSGLVFYWLLNNVFSLVKNIFYKLKNPKKVLSILSAAAGLGLLVFTAFNAGLDMRQKILLIAAGALLLVPSFVMFMAKKNKVKPSKATVKDTAAFYLGAVLMALLTGLLIPSAVINDSALEFIDIMGTVKPVTYITYTMLVSFGSWVLWGGIFYFFMSEKMKAFFSKAIWVICGVGVINYLLFGTKLGYLSSTLKYEHTPVFKFTDYLINALAVIAVAALFSWFYSKFRKVSKMIIVIGILTVAAIGGLNFALVAQSFSWYSDRTTAYSEKPSIPLSTDGQNVIVLMLDRAMGPEIPYIFNDKPELYEKFDGFTYYSNTISYGSWTLTGAPALYGGYDYTPEKINERTQLSLEEKHNESLKVMPEIFGKNDYTVTICDPSYAGYEFIPDLSIYDGYDGFNCYNTNGYFSFFDDEENSQAVTTTADRLKEIRNRNFFCYSLMKVSPLVLQETIYDKGTYNDSSVGNDKLNDVSLAQQVYGTTKSTGYYIDFLNAYAVLDNLPEITTIEQSDKNTFLLMENDTAHAPCLLQEPDYVPAIEIDNTEYDTDMVSRYTISDTTMKMETEYQVIHVHANTAALIKLGEWFDYMRANGVYDNTRIIIVADHGRALGQFDDVICEGTDIEYFTPLLMVKDFNATGFTISDEFMTNADTPALAMADIIENPVNPFTNNPINFDAKAGPQNVLFSEAIDTSDAVGATFPSGKWYVYEGQDPLDVNNWSYQGEH